MNPYILANLSGVDSRLQRVLQDLTDRINLLTNEMGSPRPGLDKGAARREKPVEGTITIPYRDAGGQDGLVRVSKDGVIVAYVNPAESIFPYADLTVVGNITTGLDQLHAFTLPAGTLANDGDCLWVRYGGVFAANDNDKRILVEFDGQAIHDTGLFDQDSGSWLYDLLYTRTSPTSVKTSFINHWNFGNRDGAGTAGGNYFFAGLFGGNAVSNLNTTSVVLRLMAEGAATDDIQQGLSFIDLIKPRTVKLV